jgi:hypothetical protein
VYSLANGNTASKVYFDITRNTSAKYTFQATKGWDYVTGWGTPAFDQIFAALSQ